MTRANIRIWIHDRDLGRLQQMLWEGHGGKLRVETSNNPRVKRFLDAVPYIMASGVLRHSETSVMGENLNTSIYGMKGGMHGGSGCACMMSIEKAQGKTQLGRATNKWKGNIK